MRWKRDAVGVLEARKSGLRWRLVGGFPSRKIMVCVGIDLPWPDANGPWLSEAHLSWWAPSETEARIQVETLATAGQWDRLLRWARVRGRVVRARLRRSVSTGKREPGKPRARCTR